MATSVQDNYRLKVNAFAAGQIADTAPCFRESGRLNTGTIDSIDQPDTLPFGFACGWTGENEVARYVRRNPIALLNATINSGATTVVLKAGEFRPGFRHVSVGEYIIIGTEWMLVTGVSASGLTVLRNQYSSGAATHNSDAEIYVPGGSTNFAGVAVKDITLPGRANDDDNYHSNDHVSVGSSGDFVVVCDAAVARGDQVSVNVSGTAADYGKFSNASPVHTSRGHIGIPGAVFMTASVSTTPYSGGTAQNLAVMRLGTQPR